jgi:hypothetical protein
MLLRGPYVHPRDAVVRDAVKYMTVYASVKLLICVRLDLLCQ